MLPHKGDGAVGRAVVDDDEVCFLGGELDPGGEEGAKELQTIPVEDEHSHVLGESRGGHSVVSSSVCSLSVFLLE